MLQPRQNNRPLRCQPNNNHCLFRVVNRPHNNSNRHRSIRRNQSQMVGSTFVLRLVKKLSTTTNKLFSEHAFLLQISNQHNNNCIFLHLSLVSNVPDTDCLIQNYLQLIIMVDLKNTNCLFQLNRNDVPFTRREPL